MSHGSSAGAFRSSIPLAASQSTNGGVVAFLIPKDGSISVQELNLAHTGGVPRVAFGGSNYLMVWPDFEKLPGGIYNTSYIRQYARAIDFDEAELLAYYHSRTDVQPAIPIAQEKRQNLRDFRFLMQH